MTTPLLARTPALQGFDPDTKRREILAHFVATFAR